ncbi:MAG: hypothetical protein M0R80_21330 [Proteobacteria bacterium]|jgi:hypothetical protein|nr:hypothetical protein [Pseudomonadota bacterium]
MRKTEKNVPASPGDAGALRAALVCLVVLTVLCAAFAVLARAGGGESYGLSGVNILAPSGGETPERVRPT